MQFFDQNYGLTSLEKIQKFDYIWSAYFYTLETIRFLSIDVQKLFQDYFCPKTKMKQLPFFDQNHGLTSLENIQKCD